jgi:hypothetical protein
MPATTILAHDSHDFSQTVVDIIRATKGSSNPKDDNSIPIEQEQLLDYPWLSPNIKALFPVTDEIARELPEHHDGLPNISDAFANSA